jgi:hypothetical protein
MARMDRVGNFCRDRSGEGASPRFSSTFVACLDAAQRLWAGQQVYDPATLGQQAAAAVVAES